MKVLFLDVDGVLNKQENFNPARNPGPWPVDDYCVFLVGKIIVHTDCNIVVSSSWRHHDDAMEAINKKFPNVIGKTPTKAGIRGNEIQAWLDEHPEVTKYAILDDDSDMLPEQKPNFFKTSFLTGITNSTAEKVIKHLNS